MEITQLPVADVGAENHCTVMYTAAILLGSVHAVDGMHVCTIQIYSTCRPIQHAAPAGVVTPAPIVQPAYAKSQLGTQISQLR